MEMMESRISLLGVVGVLALLFVVVCAVANPGTRRFVLALLGACVGLVFAFLLVMRLSFQAPPPQPPHAITLNRKPQLIEAPPAPSPKDFGPESRQPKTTVIAALGDAILQGWKARNLAPTAPTVLAAAKTPKAAQPDVHTLPQPPEWVGAPAKIGEDGYVTSVRVGPFTSPLECERELPKAVQGAVAEYAELRLGLQAGAVRLPDEALRALVRQRWDEVRPMEIGDTSQDMVTWHAQVVLDDSLQKRIKDEAQRLVIGQRVQGAAVVFGGLLGLLALTWGGLKWATMRQEKLGSPS